MLESTLSSPSPHPDNDINIFKLFLDEAGKLPLLNREQEIELAKKKDAGDLTAWQTLVESNLFLTYFVALKESRNKKLQSMRILDLVEEGVFGLMTAVDKFNWQRKKKFSTHATWWIRQAIQRAIDDKDRMIRVSVHGVEWHTKFYKEKAKLERKHGRDFTLGEVITCMEADKVRAMEIIQGATAPLSLDAYIDEDETTTLGDIIFKEEKIESHERKMELQNSTLHLLDILAPYERKIVAVRYHLDEGFDLKPEELVRIHNLPEEKVKGVIERAFLKMRLFAENHPKIVRVEQDLSEQSESVHSKETVADILARCADTISYLRKAHEKGFPQRLREGVTHHLTQEERMILMLFHQQNYSFGEIEELVSEHENLRNKVVELYCNAVVKLDEYLQPQKVLDFPAKTA